MDALARPKQLCRLRVQRTLTGGSSEPRSVVARTIIPEGMSTTGDVTSCNSSYRSSGRAKADLTCELTGSRGRQPDLKPILRSSQIAEDNGLVQAMAARGPIRPTAVILGS
ncbi:pilus assembly protein [Lasius niger]|uniref:Pilus assembly protein n=1 Tax=Lasius niger TaxID=67767 RepID=A0A0J7K197_LASNI|nr:pilus assembly protein [Lasius niger]